MRWSSGGEVFILGKVSGKKGKARRGWPRGTGAAEEERKAARERVSEAERERGRKSGRWAKVIQ